MIVIKVTSELVRVCCVQCQTEKTRIQRSSPLPHGDVYSGSGTHRFSDKVVQTLSLLNCANPQATFIPAPLPFFSFFPFISRLFHFYIAFLSNSLFSSLTFFFLHRLCSHFAPSLIVSLPQL